MVSVDLPKLTLSIPEGIKIEVAEGKVKVVGAKGEVARAVARDVELAVVDGQVVVSQKNTGRQAMASAGTMVAHLRNMIKGVTEGWERVLEMVGAGYRAEIRGEELVLTVGYSHPVVVRAPAGIAFKVEKLTITVSGADRELVGQVAANIRAARPPEPYKGKGIKYTDEIVRRKPGKAAAKAGGAA